MSLGCNIEQVKENAFQQIKKIVEGNSSTISMSNKGIIIFDYTKSKKFPNLTQAYKVAVSKVNAIEKWATENVGPKFNKGWVGLYQNSTQVWLQYNFPKYVENAYKKKFAVMAQRAALQKQIEQQNIDNAQDALDAGIDSTNELYFQYEDDFDDLADPDEQYNNLQDPDIQYFEDDLGEPELDNRVVTSNPGNNFSAYYDHKAKLLRSLEAKYETYKVLNKSNYGSDKYKTDVYKFQNVITRLRDEIEHLDVNDINNVFTDVINEMDYLNKIVDTLDTDIFKNQDIINRIDFLNQAITGRNLNGEVVNDAIWDGSAYPEYEKTIVAPISNLVTKLKQKEKEIVNDLLNKDVIYQANKDNFTQEEIEALFNQMSDINMLQKYFLGINSNNDSIVGTLLNTTFQSNVQRTKQFARPFVEALKELDKKLKDKGFSLDAFFEKDEQGIDTGNIVHKYTKKYFAKLYEYYNINRDFNQASKANKSSQYNKKISWLKENTNVIDFRKLKYFKDIYGEQYPMYFTFSDEEMSKYEEGLRNETGKLFDNHVEDLAKKLAEYENYKMNEESRENNKWLMKNIVTNSPWSFIQNYYSNNSYNQIEYQSGTNTYFTYNNSRYIEFVPKANSYDIDTMQTVPTGFYNDRFSEIENDEDAFNYWNNMREIYTKHINPTYASLGQNISALSWAKFERGFVEEIQQSKGFIDFFRNLYNQAIKEFRQLWVEKGYATDKQGIKSNYTDATQQQINKLKKFLALKEMSEIQKEADNENITYKPLELFLQGLEGADRTRAYEVYKNDLLDKIARKRILSNYSNDITKTTLALAELATLHKSRQETQFIADMLFNFHKTIKDKNNKDRNNSNAKLQSWIDTNIYNKRAVSRGNEEDELSGESKHRFWKYYSDIEKDLMKVLKSLKADDSGNVNSYSFHLNGVTYSKKGSNYFEIVSGKPSPINATAFETSLEQYFNDEVEKLGIGIGPGGFGLGLMKVIINKALALNPVSGIFNRSEGMFSNMIRDNMGDYWTRGNLKYAKRFLAFANINKFSGDMLSLQSKKKLQQMKTYQQLLDELSLFQDKKNELDRKDKESRFNAWKEKLNIFQFAVDNPEFKNQSEIVLSMLMDVRITDNNGNTFKFFDGSGFPAYKAGTLELRDEFKNEANQGWEDFSLNENPALNSFFVQKVKIEDTIKRTQGNYASLDSIKVLDGNWGKFLMLFMRWMPEHVNQRFGTRSTDIIQGKKMVAGRYRGMLGNAGATGVFGSLALGLALGPAGIIAGSAAAITPFVLRRFWGKYIYKDEQIQGDLLDLQTTLGFMQEILLQTLNLPLKATYSNINLDSEIINKRLNNSKTLNQDQINALRGMAQESAIMISQLMLLLLAKGLLWDEDDKDDSFRRQLHNFVDNQGNRSINSLLVWSNPKQFMEDNSKLAMLRYIGDGMKFVDFTWKYFNEDKGTTGELLYNINKVQPIIPIPNALAKGALNFEPPGLDKREYQNAQWFDKYIKGSEWRNEQKLKNRRSAYKAQYEKILRDKYEAKNLPEEEIDKMVERKVRKRMRQKDISKRKTETNTNAIERIDFDSLNETIERDIRNK